jgi:hypothetical protein
MIKLELRSQSFILRTSATKPLKNMTKFVT